MTSGPVDTATAEPLPTPESEAPPHRRLPPGEWVRENLFDSPLNTVLTIVFGALIAFVVFRATRFLFFTGRWEIVQVNLTNYMIGRFPRGEVHRIWIAIFLASMAGGIGIGLSGQRQRALGVVPDRVGALRRAAPALFGLLVILSLTRTITPTLLVLATFAVGAVGWWFGRKLPERTSRRMPLIYLATGALAYVAITQFGGVGYGSWGGLLLTLFVALAAIILSFPFGVLLALGRRSTFPVVRIFCVGYIELIRGVPLITLLFMSAQTLGFFLPPGMTRPQLITRGLVAFVMFAAAYVAEIVRGGLQSVPKGQTEAAQAIGLSPLKITFLIVLPQALRNVIPALVGQFISLTKDTALLTFLAVLEILGVAQSITSQPAFLGQGLQAEALAFAGFLFWIICYSMSRASQRLEKRLGVGER
jgi:general L-amino acid transport system permease protein